MKQTYKDRLSMAPILVFLMLTMTACGSMTRELEQVDADTAALQVKIKGALIKADDIDAAAIMVKAEEKTVVLSGFVDSDRESKRAEQIAAESSAAVKIINNLEVR